MALPCGKFKVPEIPEIDTSKLPDGVNFPKDLPDPNALKDKLKPPSFGDKLKNAAGAIGSNIKKTLSAFNPATIAAKVAEGVGNMVGEIAGAVTGALDGLSSLKDKIENFDPGKLIPDSPAAAFKNIEGQLDKAAESAKSRLEQLKADCGKKSVNKAAGVAAGMEQKAKSAAGQMTNKERVEIAKSPELKAQKQKQIEAQTAADMTNDITNDIKSNENEPETGQESEVADATHAEQVTQGAPRITTTCDVAYLKNTLDVAVGWVKQIYFYTSKANEVNEDFLDISNRTSLDLASSVAKAIHISGQMKAYAAHLMTLVKTYDNNCPDKKITQEAMYDNTISVLTYLETSHDIFTQNDVKLASTTEDIIITQDEWRKMFFDLFSSPESMLKEHILNVSDLTKTTTNTPFPHKDGFWVKYSGGGDYENTLRAVNMLNQDPQSNWKQTLRNDVITSTELLKGYHSSINGVGEKFKGVLYSLVNAHREQVQKAWGATDISGEDTTERILAHQALYTGGINGKFPNFFMFPTNTSFWPANGTTAPFESNYLYAIWMQDGVGRYAPPDWKIDYITYVGKDSALEEVWGDGFKL